VPEVSLSIGRVQKEFRIGPTMRIGGLALLLLAGATTLLPEDGRPLATFSSETVDFGVRPIGESSVAVINLTNTGTSPLTLRSLAITEGNTSDFSLIQNCPSTLSAGANCSLKLTFRPIAPGPRKALISVSDGAGTAVRTAVLTGVGTSLELSSRSLMFGAGAQSITVSNRGGATIRMEPVRIAGPDARDFSVTSTYGPELTAGAACTVMVKYLSKAREVRSGSLLIRDDGCNCTPVVSLVGAGGQFMVLSADKTHLVSSITHKPVFMVGEQAYSLATNLSGDSDIEYYLSVRQSMGFNLLWVGATDIAYLVDSPNNALGDPPFNGAPFTRMNEAYFAHLDYVIQRAAAHGFTVELNVAFVGCGPWGCLRSAGWCPDLLAASDTDLKAFGEYLGKRYKSYPNIIWMFGGDLDLTRYPALKNKTIDIALGIKRADTVHLMTIENEDPYFASQDGWQGSTLWDVSYLYHVAKGLAASANSNYARHDFLPMFLGEDSLENETVSDRVERVEAYQAALGGATLGFVFGNCVIWPFGAVYPYCKIASGETWKNRLNSAGSVARQHLGQLMRSREHWKLVPDINHSVVMGGYGSGDTVTVTSRASDGQTIIAYIPNGSEARILVDMSKITSSNNRTKCWWFDPSSGASTFINAFANSGMRSFTPPDTNDWALVIDDDAANLPAPGSVDL